MAKPSTRNGEPSHHPRVQVGHELRCHSHKIDEAVATDRICQSIAPIHPRFDDRVLQQPIEPSPHDWNFNFSVHSRHSVDHDLVLRAFDLGVEFEHMKDVFLQSPHAQSVGNIIQVSMGSEAGDVLYVGDCVAVLGFPSVPVIFEMLTRNDDQEQGDQPIRFTADVDLTKRSLMRRVMLESCASDPPTSAFADEKHVFGCIPAPKVERQKQRALKPACLSAILGCGGSFKFFLQGCVRRVGQIWKTVSLFLR